MLGEVQTAVDGRLNPACTKILRITAPVIKFQEIKGKGVNQQPSGTATNF